MSSRASYPTTRVSEYQKYLLNTGYSISEFSEWNGIAGPERASYCIGGNQGVL